MYEDMTFETILQRMLDRIPNTLDKREGSIIYDALAPAAMELRLAYIEFDQILNESFADTASRDFLIRRCAERGIIPKSATNAVLQGEFTPTNINLIGQRFNLNKLNYVVIAKISDGVYQVRCETPGIEGNQYLGTIIPIEYIDGLQTAELTDVLIPGEDEESTESLREKYFSSFTEKSFGGNRADYLDKTNSINGVGATKITPLWNGAGTVKLTILDAEYNVATTTLVQLVQDTIDPQGDAQGYGLAPIGHIVTVDTADEVDIDIVSTITYDTDYSWSRLESQIVEVIKDYMLELRMDWANQNNLILRIAQIETRLLQIEGIIDVTGTTINGNNVNLQLLSNQIPVIHSISDGNNTWIVSGGDE